MARTTFSGPVASDNGFIGAIDSASATIVNLACTTLTIGTTKITAGAATGTVGGSQVGRIPVLVGSTTLYIGLYPSFTP